MADQKQSKLKITLPDGKILEFPSPVTGADIAKSIGPGLAKAALAVKINGELWDLSREIEADAAISIITRDSADALELIRHDTAHVLAQAVQELFPGTQVTIGPVIENGFYYDFARDEPFSTDDLEKIEKKMKEIMASDEAFVREVWERKKAIKHFQEIGEKYKAEIIQDLPETETITIYRQGKWYDLCRGPHLPSTGKIGTSFKLMKVAGAYWRGDSSKAQLQRIYGTAWRNDKDLATYLHQLEEAEKRDHRKLGREMQLFHLQEEAMGSVFWHHKGFTIWKQLEKYIRARQEECGYIEVKTPQLLDSKFWEQSGHWSKFRENMFVVPDEIPNTEEGAPIFTGEMKKLMAIKPMNCPAHIQIFNQGIKSYRDLPIRMAEFGCCHRNEAHGALHGLMRVRQMTQDDAHIFCTDDQVTEECFKFCDMFFKVYKDFGFENISVKLATRPELRAGDDAMWDRAEKALADALEQMGIEYEVAPGEGAFYGPKYEFHLTDAIGRSWQCGTMQLDYGTPERLNAHYIGEDGQKHTPVMIHRAIFGSFERFLGILIEHYGGKFPLWLAPTQAIVATITSDADAYAKDVYEALKAQGFRVELDLRNEKINYKIREHSVGKIPKIFVVGQREAEEGTVAIRTLGSAEQEVLKLDKAMAQLKQDCATPLEKAE